MSSLDFSLILACYNEGPTFEASVNKFVAQLKKLKINYEIIFVEDKSTDNTKSTLSEIVKNIQNSKVIYHNKNMGRGRSVSDGILASRGKICGYIDVDCEISPSYIPLFIKEVRGGYDLVVGKRYYEKGIKSLQRVIASIAYALIVKTLLNIPIDDTEAGYKFFNRKTITKLLPEVKSSGWFWDTEICARSCYKGFSVSQIPVLFIRRTEKISTVKLFRDSIDYAVNLFKFKKQMSKF
mgnify:CR=1 FL=1